MDTSNNDEYNLDSYFLEIKNIPKLKEDEELILARRILEDDDDVAKNKLAKANLQVVVTLAKKYYKENPNYNLLHLIDNGNLGLYKAVEKFDYSKGHKFGEYAAWWIRQAMMKNPSLI